MKTILVTGTSTGIGFATAVSLARAGHDVFATMRNPGKSPELLAQAKRDGLPITVIPLDVDSDESVAAGVKHVLDARGRIDVLVNNAGIAQFGSVGAMPLATFRQIMETNYFGTVRCIQAVLPAMRAQKSGRIINVTSVAGRLVSRTVRLLGVEVRGRSAQRGARRRGQAVQHPGQRDRAGVIETPIFGKQETLDADQYRGGRRMSAIFDAALENPVPASVIGDQVRDIVADESWQLRYPGGPAAAGIMAWRASLTDEQLIGIGTLDDDAWCDFITTNLGLNVRPHLK